MSNIVEIGDTQISREEAQNIETDLIKKYKPKFNRNYRLNNSCKLTKETFQIAVELRAAGKYYIDIAKELGVSPMTVHRALNGNTKKYEEFDTI